MQTPCTHIQPKRQEDSAVGKRPAVGGASALSILLSRLPGPKPIRPSLPHPYRMDPYSTPCAQPHVGGCPGPPHSVHPFSATRACTNPGSLCLGGGDPGPGVGLEGGPGWRLERRERTKPPTPWGGRPGSAQPFLPLPRSLAQPPHLLPPASRRPGFQPNRALDWGKGGRHAQGHTPRRRTARSLGRMPVSFSHT